MRCPYCQVDDKDRVVDSRPVEGGQAIRRRRICEKCNRRYTTYERIEDMVRLQVVKKDGTRVPFDRNRILAGIQKACYKRPVAAENIARLSEAVEEELTRNYQREVPSKVIGESVMKYLRLLDPIAYVRFASVYREFQDVHQLVDEARNVLEQPQEEDPTQQDLFP
ncbi:MAG: transcriptional regulator NrdR [Phycisphaerales bacterium]|nr:transcriptional regulator NrdR [Phycisphaerales bacterium]